MWIFPAVKKDGEVVLGGGCLLTSVTVTAVATDSGWQETKSFAKAQLYVVGTTVCLDRQKILACLGNASAQVVNDIITFNWESTSDQTFQNSTFTRTSVRVDKVSSGSICRSSLHR